ncbi:MAG: nuclear transport factor 2 family protein [Lysobacterales bacterium]
MTSLRRRDVCPSATAGVCLVLAMVLSLVLFMPVFAEHHETLSADRAQQIEQACLKTNRDYQYYRDRGDAQAYASLFSEQGEFVLSNTVSGRKAIAAAMTKRFSEQRSRHFTNVVQMNATGPHSAEGLVYLLLFRGPQGETSPLAIDGMDLVAQYHDQYEMEGDRCLIRQRRVEVIFTRR